MAAPVIGTGFQIAQCFDQNAALPLDSRDVVTDITARNALASTSRYILMIVKVLSDGKSYQLQGGILDANWVDVTSSGGIVTVTNGLTAFAGGGQGSALLLPSVINQVTTVATAGDSVILPVGVPGMQIVVINAGANSMDIFPGTGAAIDSLATNAAYPLKPTAKNVQLMCITSTLWVSAAGGGGGGALIGTTSKASPLQVSGVTAIPITTDDQRQIIYLVGWITGALAHVSMDSISPQIGPGLADNQELWIVGCDDDGTVTFVDGYGLVLDGPVTLGRNKILKLFWDQTNWIQSKGM